MKPIKQSHFANIDHYEKVYFINSFSCCSSLGALESAPHTIVGVLHTPQKPPRDFEVLLDSFWRFVVYDHTTTFLKNFRSNSLVDGGLSCSYHPDYNFEINSD